MILFKTDGHLYLFVPLLGFEICLADYVHVTINLVCAVAYDIELEIKMPSENANSGFEHRLPDPPGIPPASH